MGIHRFGVLIALLVLLLPACDSGGGGGTNQTPMAVFGDVTGFVTDSSDGSTIAGVTISIRNIEDNTNIDGEYSVLDVPVGSQTITAFKKGYDTYSADVIIEEGMTANHAISLIPITPISAIEHRHCQDILDADANAVDYLYEVDVDGTGPMVSFSVYCDMTNQGGGWTLYARHEDGVPSITAVDEVSINANGVLRSDRWMALRDLMTTGMMFLDEHGNVSTLSSTKLLAGNCGTPSQIDDLTTLQDPNGGVDVLRPYIFHDETVDCNSAGGDSTLIMLIGDRASLYESFGASLFQRSAVKFDIWPYSDQQWSFTEQDQLYYFVK